MTLPVGAELGTTQDPRQLVKGEPAQIDANVDRLTDEATRIDGLRADFEAVKVEGWSGGYAQPAYQTVRSDDLAKWKAYGRLLTAASKSLATYAGALRTAQGKAADAIAKWQEGEDATAQAVTDYNEAVDNYNAYVARQSQVRVPSYGGPTVPSMGPAKPGPFVDPGEALRGQAQQILDDAREALDDAGATAVRELGGLEGAKTEGSAGAFNAGGSVKEPEFSWGAWDDTFGKNPTKGPDGKYDDGAGESKFKISLGEAEGYANVWGAKGSWEDYWGSAKVHADGSVTVLGADGKAEASLTGDGVVIGADGKITVLGAEGSVGADWDHASLGAHGELFGGADAKGEVLAGGTGGHADGELFAGAKASGDLEAEVGGVGAKGTAEAWAGAGIAGNANFGYDDGKITVGASGGLAWGVGGKLGVEFTIDPAEVLDTGKDLIEGIGDLFS